MRRKDKASLIYRPDLGLLAGSFTFAEPKDRQIKADLAKQIEAHLELYRGKLPTFPTR